MNIYPDIKGGSVQWDAVVFGHLKWNRYFGESPEAPPRGDPSTCGSTLITGKARDGSVYRLLIDPTLRRSREEYDFDVFRRTGLHLEAVTHCFVTHHHGDHFEALPYLPHAQWCTALGNIPLIREQSGEIAARLAPAEGEFLPGVYAVPLPGHTLDIHGIAFSSEGKKVLIAGDAVMTRGHFRDRATEYQPDPAYIKIAGQTIENIQESFDVIMPGHDNLVIL